MSRKGQLLGLSLGGGEVHHQDPLRPERRLVLRWRIWLNSDSGLLADEVASSWRWPLLGCGMLSIGLRPLPFMTNVESLGGEVNFWLWHHHQQGKPHRGLWGQSILHPWGGRGGSERGPRATPSGGRASEASFPNWCHEELLSGVLNHGPPQGRCPAASWAHESGAFVTLPGGKAQAAEVVGDELKVPKANGFTEGQSTAH
jgi:hypothetical protein